MTVYVLQDQLHYDEISREMKPKFNLRPAEDYGQIKFLLSPSASPFRCEGIVEELHVKLKDFTEDDYLLLIGNPILIGVVTAIAAKYCEVITFLQWSGKDNRYLPVTVDTL